VVRLCKHGVLLYQPCPGCYGETDVLAMGSHVGALARTHDISVELYNGGGRAYRRSRSVSIREVKGVSTYFVALHEVAHVIARGRAAHKLEMEANCWQWAIEHAIRKPTPGVEKMIDRSLMSYYRRAVRRRANGRPDRLPSEGHVFWELCPSAKDYVYEKPQRAWISEGFREPNVCVTPAEAEWLEAAADFIMGKTEGRDSPQWRQRAAAYVRKVAHDAKRAAR
jgi:hypothetical protein